MKLLFFILLIQDTADSETTLSTNWWGIIGLVLLALLATWLRRKMR